MHRPRKIALNALLDSFEMSLKPPAELCFYSEYEDEELSLTGCFCVGLFSVPSHAALCSNEAALVSAKSKPRRLFEFRAPAAVNLQPMPTRPDCICRAGAMVRQLKNALVIENIGADKGYGPTLYAAIIELARKRKLKGAMPCRESKKVLQKPKEIWRRFSEESQWSAQVHVQEIAGEHEEKWLNQVFSVADGASLINIDLMRDNWDRFSLYWTARGSLESTWTDMCRDKARLSVAAHQAL